MSIYNNTGNFSINNVYSILNKSKTDLNTSLTELVNKFIKKLKKNPSICGAELAADLKKQIKLRKIAKKVQQLTPQNLTELQPVVLEVSAVCEKIGKLCEKNNIVPKDYYKFIKKFNGKINFNSKKLKATPLISAVKQDNRPLITLLADLGADLNKCNQGISPLNTAIINDCKPETIELLLRLGAKNIEDDNGLKPISCAKKSGREDLVKLFVSLESEPARGPTAIISEESSLPIKKIIDFDSLTEPQKEEMFKKSIGDPVTIEMFFKTGWLPSTDLFSEVLGKKPQLAEIANISLLINHGAIDSSLKTSILEQIGMLLAKYSDEDPLRFIEIFKINDPAVVDRIKMKAQGFIENVYVAKIRKIFSNNNISDLPLHPELVERLKSEIPDEILLRILPVEFPKLWLMLQVHYLNEWKITAEEHTSFCIKAAIKSKIFPSSSVETIKPLLMTIFKFRDPAIKLHILSSLFAGEISRDKLMFMERISKATERQQLVGMIFYPIVHTLKAEQLKQLDSIFEKIKSFNFLKDGLKLRRFLLFLHDIIHNSFSESSAALKLIDISLQKTNKTPEAVMKIMQQLSIFLLMKKTELLKSLLTENTVDFDLAIREIYQEISGCSSEELEEQWAAFQKIFQNNLNRPLFYWNKLSTLDFSERELALKGFRDMLGQAINNTFQTERYNMKKSPHLQLVIGSNVDLLKNWQESVRISCDSSSEKSWVCEDSDNFMDLLMMGHVTESCQSTSADPLTSKGLLGILNGRTKIIVVKDETGAIVARALIRLLWDPKNKRPLMMLERIYNGRPTKLELSELILELAARKAETLGIPLVSVDHNIGEPYSGSALFEKDRAPFEYVDSDTPHMHYGHKVYEILNRKLYVYKPSELPDGKREFKKRYVD